MEPETADIRTVHKWNVRRAIKRMIFHLEKGVAEEYLRNWKQQIFGRCTNGMSDALLSG